MENNFVAKHMRKFNKAKVEDDRKKKDKRGYTKHKGRISDLSFCLLLHVNLPTSKEVGFSTISLT